MIKVLSQLSECIGKHELAINLKKPSSSMSDEETNDTDSEEDNIGDVNFYIICQEVNQFKLYYQSTENQYFAATEFLYSREANPIFIPPPNA